MLFDGVIKTNNNSKYAIILVKTKLNLKKSVSNINRYGYHSYKSEIEQGMNVIYKKINPCYITDNQSQSNYSLILDNAEILGEIKKLNLDTFYSYKGITLPDELYGTKNTLNINNTFIISILNESPVKVLGEIESNNITVKRLELVTNI